MDPFSTWTDSSGYFLEGREEPVDLLPPVVEEIIERKRPHHPRDQRTALHRIYMAYLEWVIPQVIYVRGLPKKRFPTTPTPFPKRDWTKIELLDEIPTTYIKKWHRIEKKTRPCIAIFKQRFSQNVGGPQGPREERWT